MKQHIKTNIKFYKGLNGCESRVYGLVTKVGGSWRGCRETDKCKRKIVFVSAEHEKDVIPNALYSCTLCPMRGDNGFIAVSIRLIKFPANISMKTHGGEHFVKVTFGNKKLIYNPASSDPKQNDIRKIADYIRSCIDLENASVVAEEFIDNALAVKHLYTQKNVYDDYVCRGAV